MASSSSFKDMPKNEIDALKALAKLGADVTEARKDQVYGAKVGAYLSMIGIDKRPETLARCASLLEKFKGSDNLIKILTLLKEASDRNGDVGFNSLLNVATDIAFSDDALIAYLEKKSTFDMPEGTVLRPSDGYLRLLRGLAQRGYELLRADAASKT